MRTLKVVDLFSGAGGMSLGFQKAGFNVVLAIDNWDAAVQCYSTNFPNHPALKRDISNVDDISNLLRQKKFDVIIGGPPCQDFSTAGNQEEGERANLTKSFARIVSMVRPRYFVMENVPSAKRSKAFAVARRYFKTGGYGLTEIVLDASYCGVPQRRKRFFCIGVLGGRDGAIGQTLQTRQSDLPKTIRDCLGRDTGLDFFYAHPRTYRRRAIFSVDEPAPTIRSGGNRPMPAEYRRHRSDVVDPAQKPVRPFTFEERAALQMFPADYKWGESRVDNELLVSNAVPVGLAQFVAEALLGFATNPATAPRPCFLTWLCEDKHFSTTHANMVLSRYRRARSFVLRPFVSDVKLLWHLCRTDAFKRLSKPTKKNLATACKLHVEFQSIKQRRPKT